jgi:steroid delta-isomerase-like uncharacterized protein
MTAVRPTNNKSAFQRFHDAISTGDMEIVSTAVDELFDPNVLLSTPLPVDAAGAEGIKQAMAMLLRAFPDLHVKVEDMIEEGDKVAGRNLLTGTHRGDYLGQAPTGKVVEYREIFIFRFFGGRVAETWGVVDVFAQLRQLGVLPVGVC